MSRFNQQDDMPFDDGEQARAAVKWFNVTKGFGFVAPENGSPDAFLHISVLNRAGLHEIGDGAELICMIAGGPKGPQVTRIVEVIGGGAPARPAGTGRVDRVSGEGPSAEISGTVKWFKPDKGFGFVTPDDSGKDVFVHKSVLRRSGLAQIETGQRVQMRIQEASKGREAVWIIAL